MRSVSWSSAGSPRGLIEALLVGPRHDGDADVSSAGSPRGLIEAASPGPPPPGAFVIRG